MLRALGVLDGVVDAAVARQQFRRGAVQERGVGILHQRALIGGERVVDLTVEFELAPD